MLNVSVVTRSVQLSYTQRNTKEEQTASYLLATNEAVRDKLHLSRIVKAR